MGGDVHFSRKKLLGTWRETDEWSKIVEMNGETGALLESGQTTTHLWITTKIKTTTTENGVDKTTQKESVGDKTIPGMAWRNKRTISYKR